MLIDEVKECSKCGICRSVCPVFLAVNDEVMSPRGRVSLIEAMLEGGLTLSERYIDTIRSCIKCMRCSSVCPLGVRVDRLVQSARNLLYEKGVSDIAERVLFNSENFRSALQALKKSRGSAPRDVKVARNNLAGQAGSGIPLWLLPLFFHEKAHIPELAEETVLNKYPEYIVSNGRLRVALFIGCSINYAHTAIADSAIEVLKKLNVDVFLPKEQLCCGAPLLLFGDRDGAKELAKRNLTALKAEEFDAVVILCPACGVTLKSEYEHIVDGNIESFILKVCDISEFIDKFTNYKTDRMNVSVTYHDPCYLRLRQKVVSEPRQILGNIAQFIEMEDADRCCGLGVTLGLFHPEISMKIGEAKIKSIMKSGADIVATGCPGCILFLKDQLAKKGIKKKILHTVQVLQQNLSS